MSVWKKILIHAGVGVVLIGVGFGIATLYFGSTTTDLRERIKDLTSKYDAATAAQREADNTVATLEQRNRDATATVDRLTKQINDLSATNNWLTGRIADLEGSIKIISDGLRDVTNTTTESGGLIQKSLQLLLSISERNGKANQ